MSVSCRYLGQNYEQEVRMYDDPEVDGVLAIVARPLRRDARAPATATASPDAVMELVQVNAVAVEGDPIRLATRPVAVHRYAAGATAGRTERPVLFAGEGWVPATIVRRDDLRPGDAPGRARRSSRSPTPPR